MAVATVVACCIGPTENPNALKGSEYGDTVGGNGIGDRGVKTTISEYIDCNETDNMYINIRTHRISRSSAIWKITKIPKMMIRI
jgi:hypothetical protein